MMRQIIFNEQLTFCFQLLGKKVRLIISEADIALVCRKEIIKNLKSFLLKDEVRIFKGRFQLNKYKGIVEVIMKDNLIAIILASKLEQVINDLN